ncbi:MAG TPA: phosphoribosylformylglycinamidine synthase subunit PurQ [Acidimicrobiales bacterium]|nr:phosphoribosylformylglycinamidine synthase subunit PurQ [Acidimicrobiales bacterium]
MAPLIGVVEFPGTNCERDVAHVLEILGGRAEILWHGESSVKGADAIVIPGGFAHGDYLRAGAIARFSPVMTAVAEFARGGGPVLGICNGFQVLTEAGLLPGALHKNSGLRFLCQEVALEVVGTDNIIGSRLEPGRVLHIPINHFEGSYVCSHDTLRNITESGQIVLRYVDNPNGSVGSIAAVANIEGNVVGMMPHPERASDVLLGSTDGIDVLGSLIDCLAGDTEPTPVDQGH